MQTGKMIAGLSESNGASGSPAGHSPDEAMELSVLIPKLSVVLPLYNEEACLKENFETIKTYLDAWGSGYEVILINDGSSDSTLSIMEDIAGANPQVRLVNNTENRGKGHAVKSGILKAARKYIIYTDADLAVPVYFIGNCLKHLDAGPPIVIGSRHLPESSFKIREGFLRRFLGEIFRTLARFALGLKVSDITCGMKGFERNTALKIFSRSKIERWGYDAEVLFLGRRLGYDIAEIPVDWYHSFDSKVKVGAASVKTLMEMFQIGYNYFTRQYDL